MNELVAYTVAVYALGAAAYAAWHMVAERPFSNPLFYVIAALEVALIGLLVAGSVALAGPDGDGVEGVLFISYLVTTAVIPPAAVLWGIAEKSRWGSGVVVVAMLTVSILLVRELQIWQAGHA
ncbi:MAG: hypothetical protein QM621_05105 [Aeromicrobium sp.]|uniref:hypothetical protein n=1 Tax=Aeromicrobium sp. TaxID=1871063 RepID=UPI0039E287A3